MAISPQRLTIYLYSAHRAVIFAIAQLSCMYITYINTGNIISKKQRFIDRAIGQWRRRLESVVQQQGGHIEHLM